MHKKVLIVGGGITGMICSYIFSKHQKADVTMIETKECEKEFLDFGLEYVHRTDNVISILLELNVLFSSYTIRGGILLRDKVYPHPEYLRKIKDGEAKRIQSDYYRKTRLAEPDERIKKTFSDPLSFKPRRALRVDFETMQRVLKQKINIILTEIESINGNELKTKDGKLFHFDFLIVTLPLWVVRRLVDWYLPEAVAMKLNASIIEVKQDNFRQWDYIYTPYTPSNSISRIVSFEDGYVVETCGNFNYADFSSDLNFLFGGGWYVRNVHEGLKGYLLPLSQQNVKWPFNIAPVGRFAKWDSRITFDNIIDEVFELEKRWLGNCQL